MSTAVQISAADVNKLRNMTGAGMMDCKKALTEANGDFEKAIDELRKKGQKVAASRGDRDAKEGVVLAKTTADGKRAVLGVVNCETDFVAKNEEFGKFVDTIVNIAIEKNLNTIDDVKAQPFPGSNVTVADKIIEQVGKIGEKIDLTKLEVIEAAKVVAYNHPGNRLATIVGFSKDVNEEVSKNIAMQIAAMAPVALDRGDVDKATLDRELEIAKEQVRQEGKPEDMVEKIAQGKLNKFYKESTLLNQEFIKDGKKTVAQYLKEADGSLSITGFKRFALS